MSSTKEMTTTRQESLALARRCERLEIERDEARYFVSESLRHIIELETERDRLAARATDHPCDTEPPLGVDAGSNEAAYVAVPHRAALVASVARLRAERDDARADALNMQADNDAVQAEAARLRAANAILLERIGPCSDPETEADRGTCTNHGWFRWTEGPCPVRALLDEAAERAEAA